MLFFFGGDAETRDGPSPESQRSAVGTTGGYHRHDSGQSSAHRQEGMAGCGGKCLPDRLTPKPGALVPQAGRSQPGGCRWWKCAATVPFPVEIR